MSSLGYRVAAIKFGAVMIAGLVAGAAGVLAVWQTEFISPSVAQFSRSALAVVMVILGGTGTLLGPLVGAAIVIGAEYWLSTYVERWATVLGVIFIVVVLFARRGIVGELEALLHRRRGSGIPTDGREPLPVTMEAVDRPASRPERLGRRALTDGSGRRIIGWNGSERVAVADLATVAFAEPARGAAGRRGRAVGEPGRRIGAHRPASRAAASRSASSPRRPASWPRSGRT